jgi:hypothetical protein
MIGGSRGERTDGRAATSCVALPFGSASEVAKKGRVLERRREEAAEAVRELRLFVSLYDDAQVRPESREARKLEAARRAIAAYEEAERWEQRQSA